MKTRFCGRGVVVGFGVDYWVCRDGARVMKRLLLAAGLGLLALKVTAQEKAGRAVASPVSTTIETTRFVGKKFKLVSQDMLRVNPKSAWFLRDATVGLYIGRSDIWSPEQKTLVHASNAEIDAYTERADRFLGVYIKRDYKASLEGFRTGTYTLYDNKGRVAFRLSADDGRLIFTPAPDGTYLIGHYGIGLPPTPPIRFTEKSKQLASDWAVQDRALAVSISPDSNLVAFISGGESPEKLLLYSRALKKIAELPKASAVHFCSDSKCFLVQDEREFRYYSDTGVLLSTYKMPGAIAEMLEIVPQQDQAITVLSNNEIRCFNIKTGETIWSSRLPAEALGLLPDDKSLQFLATSVAEKGGTVAVIVRSKKTVTQNLTGWGQVTDEIPTHDSIAVFDGEGNHLSTLILPVINQHPMPRPIFKLSANGKKISIFQPGVVSTYEIGR